jgi:hypothetical protein
MFVKCYFLGCSRIAKKIHAQKCVTKNVEKGLKGIFKANRIFFFEIAFKSCDVLNFLERFIWVV